MQISNFKLGIGIPISFHMLPLPFFESFICMEKPDFVFIRPNMGDNVDPRQWRVDSMRNNIVEQARASGCTHLWMIDTDQQYPQDALVKMLSHKKMVVGARVRRRYPPFDNLFFRGEIGKWHPIAREESLSGDLIEVDTTGTGCILFDMRVFNKIKGPWFRTMELDGKPVGEDFGFCSMIRKAGIKIYIDTSVYITHLSQFGITDGFADIYNKISEEKMKQKEITEKEKGNGF